MAKKWLVAVNVRYKEYYLIPNAETAEEAKQEAICCGDEVESLRQYVEAMPIETWDEPEELTEERFQELFEDRETYKNA